MTGLRAATSLVLGIVLAACTPGPTQPSPSPGPSSGGPSPATTAAASAAASAPSLLPSATAAALPNPGGTCTAAQLVTTGDPLAFPGYAAMGYALVFIRQGLRNAGERCVLQLPGVLGIVLASGSVRPVPVTITRSPPSIEVEPGQPISIVLGDSWWLGYTEVGASPPPAPRCDGRIEDVHRVELPLASGSIEIAWDAPWSWHEVCTAPPSVTVTAEDSVQADG